MHLKKRSDIVYLGLRADLAGGPRLGNSFICSGEFVFEMQPVDVAIGAVRRFVVQVKQEEP
jgi:hypothetical protein